MTELLEMELSIIRTGVWGEMWVGPQWPEVLCGLTSVSHQLIWARGSAGAESPSLLSAQLWLLLLVCPQP